MALKGESVTLTDKNNPAPLRAKKNPDLGLRPEFRHDVAVTACLILGTALISCLQLFHNFVADSIK